MVIDLPQLRELIPKTSSYSPENSPDPDPDPDPDSDIDPDNVDTFTQSQIWVVVMQVSLAKGQMRLSIGLLTSGSLSDSSHGNEAPIKLCAETTLHKPSNRHVMCAAIARLPDHERFNGYLYQSMSVALSFSHVSGRRKSNNLKEITSLGEGNVGVRHFHCGR